MRGIHVRVPWGAARRVAWRRSTVGRTTTLNAFHTMSYICGEQRGKEARPACCRPRFPVAIALAPAPHLFGADALAA